MNIYISKSNECDPTLVALVRSLITSSGNEVIEYNPSDKYNPELIKSCERIILIPPANQEHIHNSIIVGRGIFGEIYDNISTPSYLLKQQYETFHKILGGDKIDEGKSWKQYGILQYSPDETNFLDIIKGIQYIK